MHKLKSIDIRGFRGQAKPIRLNLSPDANFLIGRNGTGKTTLINLINAALQGDVEALRDSRFDSINLLFRKTDGPQAPRVKIEHAMHEDRPVLRYSIRTSNSETDEIYVVHRPSRPRFVAGEWHTATEAVRRRVRQAVRPPLKGFLGQIYKTTWLSLQRGTSKQDLEEWEQHDGTEVDWKLEQVANDMARYFTRLDRSVAELTQEFQKSWFLSFLTSEVNLNPIEMKRLDLGTEREALNAIFRSFAMSPAAYERNLGRHFDLVAEAKASFQESGGIKKVEDAIVVSDTLRLHTLVEKWQKLQSAREGIYAPKFNFVEKCSEMFFKKKVSINRSNQMYVQPEDGKEDDSIDYKKLSSGEKQLLIFLGETLLQEKETCIFLADEPELSLHVEWQEDLVPNLLSLNPNAQVLFATHSPDIVNSFQKNVFKMEELID